MKLTTLYVPLLAILPHSLSATLLPPSLLAHPLLQSPPAMHLRTLLSSALTFQSLFSATNARECKIPDGVDLLSISVESLGQYLNNGSLTSVDLVRALLDRFVPLSSLSKVQKLMWRHDVRIDKDNHRGLNLRAVIETAPLYSVLDIAGGLDKERMEGKVRGPFHGIPVLIKDNCATDVQLGMNTTAGSYALCTYRSFGGRGGD